MRLIRYFQALSTGRTILWCYAIWYATTVWYHFELSPRLWLTSVGLSAIIGTALLLSTQTGGQWVWPERWVIVRLFVMPFCVSSFAALIKDARYTLIFPPSLSQNLAGVALIGAFLLMVATVKRLSALPLL